MPICFEGHLNIPDDEETQDKTVRIIRAHLEEDAGKSMHDEVAGKADSRIDLNRTGTPLLEIVSYPDMSSADEAKAYLTELRLLLVYLGVSDCNMQEGSLRVDANVNLHIDEEGKTYATPIVEVKNMNSFRAVERALEYEVQRQWGDWQRTRIQKGEAPKQTRGWDDEKGVTIPQREKEESADYRYFPDPDLVPLKIARTKVDSARSSLGQLPAQLRESLQVQHGLKLYDADVIVSQGRELVDYFLSAVAGGAPAKRISSWLQQDVLRTLKEKDWTLAQLPVTASKLSELVKAIEAGQLDTTRGREVFQYWIDHPEADLEAAKSALGIASVDRSEIETLCRQLLADNPHVVTQFKEGNTKALVR